MIPPLEILELIINELSYKDLIKLSMTCQEMYNCLYYYILKKQNYISWKVVVHMIKTHHGFDIDKCWVILGSMNSYRDFSKREWEYCGDCEEANCTKLGAKYFRHGKDVIQTSDIVTLIKKGIGGDFLNGLIQNIEDDCIPINVLINNHIPYDSIIDISKKGGIQSYAHLTVKDLAHMNYTTDEIQEYYLSGLYLDPFNITESTDSSEELGDYDYNQYLYSDSY